jgi:hypothetical protein
MPPRGAVWSFSRICNRKDRTFSISMLLVANRPGLALLHWPGERLGGVLPSSQGGEQSSHHTADFWTRPFSTTRTASFRSAVVNREPRICK